MKEKLKILTRLLQEELITQDEFILLMPEKEDTINWYPYLNVPYVQSPYYNSPVVTTTSTSNTNEQG